MSLVLNLPLCLEARIQNVHSFSTENHKSPALLLRVIEQAAQEQIKKLNKIFSFQGPLRTEKKREGHGNLAYYKGSQVLF